MRQLRTTLLFSVTAISIAACKPDAAVKNPANLDKKAQPSTAYAPAASAPPADAGQISGSVHFTGKPPARVPIDMSMDPGCSLAGENMTEQYLVTNGKLADVYVYVKSGAPATSAAAGSPAVVLDQKGCRYTPHVIAVQHGGSVEVHNSDPTMHNVHTLPSNAANVAMDVSQGPMGQPQTRQFTAPEVMLPVRCNNHPWMNAFVNVAPNAFFAVTAPDGSFTIKGLPPSHYTLAAVHEKLGEQDMDIDVAPHGVVKADFTFAAK